MPATDHNQGSFLNRISIRRNQSVSMDNNHHDLELHDLELFQKHVADRFSDLLSADSPSAPPPLLSISWFRNLLDAFLCCEAEFKAVLVSGRDPSQFSKPPLDRLIPDLLERSVKALDVCNAVTHGVDLVHHWQKLGQIAVTALQQSPIGDGHVRRARKALATLLTSMVSDDKENANNNNVHGKLTDRTWSFGRRGGAATATAAAAVNSKDRTAGNFRSLSLSVAKSWSAAKQIQTMSANLVPPRGAEANGLPLPVYIMSTILVFVMWALVAAIPCQDRSGLAAHFQFPRNMGWAQPMIGLQEKIGEEWKKKEKKGTCGLLEEMQRMEKLAHSLVEFADSFVFPLEEEKAAEVAVQVAELAEICRKMEEGLGPLQQQLREVFHRIVRSRAEVLDVLDQLAVRRATMAASISNALSLKHGLSLWCPRSTSVNQISQPSSVASKGFRRRFSVSASSYANDNREYVIVGGGNAAGYAARTFVEHGLADGKLCIVSKEAYAPYERPALTKGYLFPLDKKPARLPGFHTCVGSGGERQTPEWYKEKGIEMLHEDPVAGIDIEKQTLKTNSGKLLKYGSLIIATGCTASRFPDKIGGNLPGVHYIRDVADANSLISSLEKAKKVVIVGGGYIGMEVAAAAVAWKVDTTIIFPEDHLMTRLFTPSLAQKYEQLYQEFGVKFVKGASIKNLEAGSDGCVAGVNLGNGSIIEADTVVVGIGAKPAVGPFESVGLNNTVGGIQVDGQFRTSIPGIFAIGDVAAFPLKIYNRIARVEHVDHARRSAQHCVKSLLTAHTNTYDYLPYFYSRVFEYEGSPRKVWWQFFGDNVGETVEVGKFDPKVATFWIDSGKLKGVLLESGSPEEFQLLPKLARIQPVVDKAKLERASSVEEALEIVKASLVVEA
ncbi:hypothetical protein BUALT_Bualt10G0055400 [Buddleja alternifolia]|uniref:monodehydroascorbate reductase (NADH) n=1 Tax=Buddleja alternifolia TaxID=168488 RepID=A0AAV6WXE6_9LAMI|nr:hypothetical protein BUALT_Bualt10G0055400 [Buddleja alternifolia]